MSIGRKRHVCGDELKRIGFPEEVIREAEQAEEKGLFDMEPSPDFVERTVERCKPLLPKVPTRKERLVLWLKGFFFNKQ